MLLPGRPPLVVAAHSIGSYVAVHAIRDVELDTPSLVQLLQLPRPRIVKVGILHTYGQREGSLCLWAAVHASNPGGNLNNTFDPQVIAMFPFLWIEPSHRINMLSIAAARYNLMAKVAQMLSWLPTWIKLAVLRHFTSMDRSHPSCLASLLSPGYWSLTLMK